tara:strand:+ start:950 stop:1129 length:180 start_codon:yes stop_codon:yes gene_type:complete
MENIAGIRLGIDLTGLQSLQGPIPLRDIQKMAPLRAVPGMPDVEGVRRLRGLEPLRFVV